MATHSTALAWKIPWTEEPGGLQSMGLQRVGHDWRDLALGLSIFVTTCPIGNHLRQFLVSIYKPPNPRDLYLEFLFFFSLPAPQFKGLFQLQLGDMAGSVPDHFNKSKRHNKASHTIFCFSVRIKVMFTL